MDSWILGLSGVGEWAVELWGCPEQESGQLDCCVTMASCEQCSSTGKGNEMYQHNTSKKLNKMFRNVRCKWRGEVKIM